MILTVIAEIRTRPGQHHRQAVLISLLNRSNRTERRRLPRLCANGGLRCWREFPVYGTGFYRND